MSYTDSEQTCWPTFDPCPVAGCDGILATDGRATWCLECEWTDRPDLFKDDTDQ